MSDDVIRIVCGRPDSLFMLAGNRLESCGPCGKSVVLSREGRMFREGKRRDGKRVELVCFECAVEAAEDTKVIGPVPGALERARRSGFANSERVRRAEQGLPLREVLSDELDS